MDPFQCSASVRYEDTVEVQAAQYAPTAQALRPDVADTPASASPAELGFGVETLAHFVPVQRIARVFGPLEPTAQALWVGKLLTPVSTLKLELGLGLGTLDQDFPFQCSVRVRSRVQPLVHLSPDAHTSPTRHW